MWFCRKADHGTPPAGYRLRLEGAEIGVGTSMKYLGPTLDSHMTFSAHFERLAPSVEATANALGRLLPRLGGPDVGVHRLYADVVRSKLLYGAPHWAENLMTNRRSLLAIRRLHRTVAIKVVRGFRTISAAAAAVLAGFPSFELQAPRCREIYLQTREAHWLFALVGECKVIEPRKGKMRKDAEKEAGKDTATTPPVSSPQSGRRMKSMTGPSATKSAGTAQLPLKWSAVAGE
ncbi:uncharacterized protein LOC117214569 [Bombus bifarius]|uniref:Uncharacterized protein LOC117214569 n=1 Tax=Bombus bifarius TaxID=103933 RepID=A0A6P8N6V6_9HYME|nr:uncharacterized protein LOC117214569 [Bombus bifarius]